MSFTERKDPAYVAALGISVSEAARGVGRLQLEGNRGTQLASSLW